MGSLPQREGSLIPLQARSHPFHPLRSDVTRPLSRSGLFVFLQKEKAAPRRPARDCPSCWRAAPGPGDSLSGHEASAPPPKRRAFQGFTATAPVFPIRFRC